MVPNPGADDWVNEFKKLNTAGSRPSERSADDPPSSKGSERRVHGRFEVDQTSTQLYKDGLLALIGVGKNNLARAAIDVSEGGAQLLVHERLAIGTKVKLKIAVEKYHDVIETTGIVRWCYQSAKKKEDFFIGVQFQGLDSAQGRKLQSMRDWFTSPQYKAVKQGRRKDKPPEIIFPK